MCISPSFVATALRAVFFDSTHLEERSTGPWLQKFRFPICAASSKQSGGTTGKILSTRFDGISDIAISPPMLQQISQKVSGDISRNAERSHQSRDRRSTTAIPIISTLHGANLC